MQPDNHNGGGIHQHNEDVSRRALRAGRAAARRSGRDAVDVRRRGGFTASPHQTQVLQHAPAEVAGVGSGILQMGQRIATAVCLRAVPAVYLHAASGPPGASHPGPGTRWPPVSVWACSPWPCRCPCCAGPGRFARRFHRAGSLPRSARPPDHPFHGASYQPPPLIKARPVRSTRTRSALVVPGGAAPRTAFVAAPQVPAAVPTPTSLARHDSRDHRGGRDLHPGPQHPYLENKLAGVCPGPQQ